MPSLGAKQTRPLGTAGDHRPTYWRADRARKTGFTIRRLAELVTGELAPMDPSMVDGGLGPSWELNSAQTVLAAVGRLDTTPF